MIMSGAYAPVSYSEKMVKTERATLGETWRLQRGRCERELGQVLIVWQAYVGNKQKFPS